MTAIPQWLTGPGLKTCTFTPQTNTAGTLTDTTPVATLTGNLDDIRISSRKETEEISPMDTLRQNMVPIKNGTTITLTEILKAATANLLANAYYNGGDYGKFVFTRNNTPTGETFTFYGLLSAYDETWPKGKSTGVLVLDMVDPGTANPVRAVA